VQSLIFLALAKVRITLSLRWFFCEGVCFLADEKKLPMRESKVALKAEPTENKLFSMKSKLNKQ
jgi:hypothetical protein